MRNTALLRFLELLPKELDARDARLELGGRDPDDPCAVFAHVAGDFRLVVVFAAPPADREAKRARIGELAESFEATLREASVPAPPRLQSDAPFQRVDAALEVVRRRAGGLVAFVADLQSPVLWGTSEVPRPSETSEEMTTIGRALEAAIGIGVDLETVCELEPARAAERLRERGLRAHAAAVLGGALARSEPGAVRRELARCLALARVRAQFEPGFRGTERLVHHEPRFGYIARGFANIYVLVVVFDGEFSELSAQAALVHALSSIEQLVLSLPPLDPEPPPRGGKVVRLRG